MSASYNRSYPPVSQEDIDALQLRGDLVLLELAIEEHELRVPLNAEKEKSEGLFLGRVIKCGPDATLVTPGNLVHSWQYYRQRGSDMMRVEDSSRLVAFVPEQNILVEISNG